MVHTVGHKDLGLCWLNMVKNVLGGKSARKGSKGVPDSQKATRCAREEGEMYASVTRLLGGQHCEVLCADGDTRLCVIRNKFRGRGKRDNTLARGTWVLVGCRDWETPPPGKLAKCDLLHVYSRDDAHRLRALDTATDWGQLSQRDHGGSDSEVDFVAAGDEDVVFASDDVDAI